MKDARRSVWTMGDYPRVAADVLAPLGATLVTACRIAPGQRVLDVGAGSGNAAIRAAEAGAEVVATDLTPELMAAGQREAAGRGVTLDWREADAEALPFGDGEFDVVMSCVGVIFAPDHQRAADELLRVCRPGGTIGLANWANPGSITEFLQVFTPYVPPAPPGTLTPVLWGEPEHVRELFADRVDDLSFTAGQLPVDHFETPAEFCAYYKANFGPTIMTYAGVADDPERTAALDRDFLAYATRSNLNPDGPRARYGYDYLLVTARKRG
jgi:ubiquinone/menaquinone biosynthesis C-methylase UbiE